jgi:hypothetical protein
LFRVNPTLVYEVSANLLTFADVLGINRSGLQDQSPPS